jgi:uncharacterized protein (DUF433 family)
MFHLRCILFNDHKIIEKKQIEQENIIVSSFVCSRCGLNESDILKNYNNLSSEKLFKILKKTI